MSRLSLPKERISILLLEGIHESAVETFRAHGYTTVESLAKAPAEDELIRRITRAHVVGIRSRTQLTEPVLQAAQRLFAIGCFCIGTDQVDLRAARRLGVPVFNAPYSNTRSVAELVLGEIIMLFRGVQPRSLAVHRGEWPKTATESYEIRGKVLGIVGYGHIGSQLSVLAEAMGMQVRFHDIVRKLAIGNARPCASLAELLQLSDVISLHVPDTPQTRNLIGREELRLMKPGSRLINAARGQVVDIDALVEALTAGHLLGAALDVFPQEPTGKGDLFESPLRGMETVILTPHIGGSTLEAQANIGAEVADKLVSYSDIGATIGAVNFPEVSLPVHGGGTRFLHIHQNVPGVLRGINEVFAGANLNITGQFLQTDSELGYVVFDVEGDFDPGETLSHLKAVPGTMRARLLF